MKKTLIVLIVLWAGFVIAECIKPPEIDPVDVPFAYDVNDAPAKVIGWMQISALSETGSEVKACDPDGDPYTIIPLVMPEGMVFDANTNWWHWTPTAEQIGSHWVSFRVVDSPPPGSEALSDEAAIVVNVLPRLNQPPVLLPFGG